MFVVLILISVWRLAARSAVSADYDSAFGNRRTDPQHRPSRHHEHVTWCHQHRLPLGTEQPARRPRLSRPIDCRKVTPIDTPLVVHGYVSATEGRNAFVRGNCSTATRC